MNNEQFNERIKGLEAELRLTRSRLELAGCQLESALALLDRETMDKEQERAKFDQWAKDIASAPGFNLTWAWKAWQAAAKAALGVVPDGYVVTAPDGERVAFLADENSAEDIGRFLRDGYKVESFRITSDRPSHAGENK